MKRRQQTPATVVALRGVPALRERTGDARRGFTLGAMTRLCDLERDGALGEVWPALRLAASVVGTPALRNVATIGGNLCLDTRTAYLKVRRRASFDFPVLGIAVRARHGAGGTVEDARIFLGGVGSRPQEATEAARFLVGRVLRDEDVLREAARLAARKANPMQNTDLSAGWRKHVAEEYAARVLRAAAQ